MSVPCGDLDVPCDESPTDEHDLADFTEAKAVIAGVIEHYNHRRVHSSLSYLRWVDYYRGDPTTHLAERRRKIQQTRELRKQENLKLRQRLIPRRQEEDLCSTRPLISL
ncbi:MAG: hypothetical protein AABZ47_00475 [Planctomycetota bacterium]